MPSSTEVAFWEAVSRRHGLLTTAQGVAAFGVKGFARRVASGIAGCRNELRARGRRKTTVLDELLLTRVPGFDPGDSDPELKLYDWLAAAGVPVVKQHRVIVSGKVRLLDLAVPESKVAIEYQGIDAHSTESAVVTDSEKVTELQLADWFVVLITKKTSRFEAIRQVRDAITRQSNRGLAATFGIELTRVGTFSAKSRNK